MKHSSSSTKLHLPYPHVSSWWGGTLPMNASFKMLPDTRVYVLECEVQLSVYIADKSQYLQHD